LEQFLIAQDRLGQKSSADQFSKPSDDNLVRLDNSDQVNRKVRRALATALADIHGRAQQEAEALATQAQTRLQDVGQSRQDLEQWKSLYLGWMALLLIVSAAGFVIAFFRRGAGHIARLRPRLSVGFGLSAICALIAVVAVSARMPRAEASQDSEVSRLEAQL